MQGMANRMNNNRGSNIAKPNGDYMLANYNHTMSPKAISGSYKQQSQSLDRVTPI